MTAQRIEIMISLLTSYTKKCRQNFHFLLFTTQTEPFSLSTRSRLIFSSWLSAQSDSQNAHSFIDCNIFLPTEPIRRRKVDNEEEQRPFLSVFDPNPLPAPALMLSNRFVYILGPFANISGTNCSRCWFLKPVHSAILFYHWSRTIVCRPFCRSLVIHICLEISIWVTVWQLV